MGKPSGDPCKGVRNAYDRCFNKWYTETYVKMGPWNRESCAKEWAEYQECFAKRLGNTKLAQLVKKEADDLMHSAPATSDQNP